MTARAATLLLSEGGAYMLAMLRWIVEAELSSSCRFALETNVLKWSWKSFVKLKGSAEHPAVLSCCFSVNNAVKPICSTSTQRREASHRPPCVWTGAALVIINRSHNSEVSDTSLADWRRGSGWWGCGSSLGVNVRLMCSLGVCRGLSLCC